MAVTLRPLSPAVGVEVIGVDLRRLSNAGQAMQTLECAAQTSVSASVRSRVAPMRG